MQKGIERPQLLSLKDTPVTRTGSEGFAESMSIFPRLREWENQIALHALGEGKTIDELRALTPFRQYLAVGRRARNRGEPSPFDSFATLFSLSPNIEMLVSFGNFQTIRTWTGTFAKRYPELNLPVEQFYQDALSTIAPSQARAYDPSYGASFQSFLIGMLKHRFLSFVARQKREQTTPVSYEEKPKSKYGQPKASEERTRLMSLDASFPQAEHKTSLDALETSYQVPEDTTTSDDNQARERIHVLATLAGLNGTQEETLIAMFVYGGNTRLLATLRRCTERSVRWNRQVALEKIEALGVETVKAVLTGEEDRHVDLLQQEWENNGKQEQQINAAVSRR